MAAIERTSSSLGGYLVWKGRKPVTNENCLSSSGVMDRDTELKLLL